MYTYIHTSMHTYIHTFHCIALHCITLHYITYIYRKRVLNLPNDLSVIFRAPWEIMAFAISHRGFQKQSFPSTNPGNWISPWCLPPHKLGHLIPILFGHPHKFSGHTAPQWYPSPSWSPSQNCHKLWEDCQWEITYYQNMTEYSWFSHYINKTRQKQQHPKNINIL